MKLRLLIILFLALSLLHGCEGYRYRPNLDDHGRFLQTAYLTCLVIILVAALYYDWRVWKMDLNPICWNNVTLDPLTYANCEISRARVKKRFAKVLIKVLDAFGKRSAPSMNGFGPQENVLVAYQGRAKLQVMDDAVVDIGPMNSVLQSCIHEKIDDATLSAIRDMIEKNHGKDFQGLDPETTNFDTFKNTMLSREPQLGPYMQLFLQSGLGRCLNINHPVVVKIGLCVAHIAVDIAFSHFELSAIEENEALGETDEIGNGTATASKAARQGAANAAQSSFHASQL